MKLYKYIIFFFCENISIIYLLDVSRKKKCTSGEMAPYRWQSTKQWNLFDRDTTSLRTCYRTCKIKTPPTTDHRLQTRRWILLCSLFSFFFFPLSTAFSWSQPLLCVNPFLTNPHICFVTPCIVPFESPTPNHPT